MIKLDKILITDLLPSSFLEDKELVSLAYAIRKAMDLALSYLDKSLIYANIDKLDEWVLDVLAIEWRSPYYDSLLSIDIKRRIIKETFALYSVLGTSKAVEDMVYIVFGSGEVIEWYEKTPVGEPYTFDIHTTANLDENVLNLFRKLLDKVKPTRSRLNRVNLGIRIESDIYIGTQLRFTENIKIL